ncbi:DUF2333 family protein [Thermodesulfobacteriota bacterium]
MDNQDNGNSDDIKNAEFTSYASKRIIVAVLLSAVVLWAVVNVLGFFSKPSAIETAKQEPEKKIHGTTEPTAEKTTGHKIPEEPGHTTGPDRPIEAHEPVGTKATIPEKAVPVLPQQPLQGEHGQEPLAHGAAAEAPRGPVGTAFVKACMAPLSYELDERFFGWRPNDIIRFSDNVENFQLGVLEVTRRTAVSLAERISRIGSTAAFELDLERAMNWFMIKADRYWLPSAESKYKDGLDELNAYLEKLEKGNATFYTRADNIIPLLMAYRDLLGSCDENLVKSHEDDGNPVSFLKADDYFYYTKGVTSAMRTILEAILIDFHPTIESRHGIESLHHAIESCRWASEIEPLVVLEADLSGIFANHRANMAAPVSHARFYLGVLITTLST